MRRKILWLGAVPVITLIFGLVIGIIIPFENYNTPEKVIEQGSSLNGIAIWAFILLVLMATALLLLSVMLFRFYRWRMQILSGSKKYLVPEVWDSQYKSVNTKIDTMIDTFMLFQKNLDEKDDLIRRYKESYDAKVFNKFLHRFIRIILFIDELLEASPKGEAHEYLLQIKMLFDDALDECDVEEFIPNVGDDFRKVEGLDRNPKKTPTNSDYEHFKINKILHCGYRLRLPVGFKIITPAKVSIYFYNN